MNSLNSNSILTTDLNEADCNLWLAFSESLRSSQSWGSQWFTVARRFFLYGGAKEFNPGQSEVDRVIDYATALEAALVPETDFSKSRCANRAAKLCSTVADEQEVVAKLVNRLYDIRSQIVHGSVLSEKARQWLKENSREIETRVRQVLIKAVKRTPANDDGRVAFLQSLFDVMDAKRGEFVVQKFREIKTVDVRVATAAQIERLQINRK